MPTELEEDGEKTMSEERCIHRRSEITFSGEDHTPIKFTCHDCGAVFAMTEIRGNTMQVSEDELEEDGEKTMTDALDTMVSSEYGHIRKAMAFENAPQRGCQFNVVPHKTEISRDLERGVISLMATAGYMCQYVPGSHYWAIKKVSRGRIEEFCHAVGIERPAFAGLPTAQEQIILWEAAAEREAQSACRIVREHPEFGPGEEMSIVPLDEKAPPEVTRRAVPLIGSMTGLKCRWETNRYIVTGRSRNKPSQVVFLGNVEGNKLRQMGQQVDDGEITHAVIVGRKADGSLCYWSVGEDHTTYSIGMLHRVAMQLHEDDR